jgi:hypothetical protein
MVQNLLPAIYSRASSVVEALGLVWLIRHVKKIGIDSIQSQKKKWIFRTCLQLKIPYLSLCPFFYGICERVDSDFSEPIYRQGSQKWRSNKKTPIHEQKIKTTRNRGHNKPKNDRTDHAGGRTFLKSVIARFAQDEYMFTQDLSVTLKRY